MPLHTYVVHFHSDSLSGHWVETQKVLCPPVHLKCVSVESSCLDVVLRSDAGHVPCCNLTVTET